MRLVGSLLLFLLAGAYSAAESSNRFDQIAKQADAARAADQLGDAERLYREALRVRPAWNEGWWSLGSVLYDQDRFSEAESAFQRVATSSHKPGPASALLGLCEYEMRNYDLALKHFRQWASGGWAGTPQLIDVGVFHFALLLTREGKFVEALYMLSTEAAKLGSTPALSEAMGLASLRIPKLPEEYSPEERESVWLTGAAATYAAQSPPDFAQADDYAHRLLAKHYDQPNVHYFIATLLTFENKNTDAEREFRDELRISPKHVPAMLSLVNLDLDKDQLQEASALVARAIELEPTNAEAHHALGRVLLAKDEIEQSIRELETAKKLAPNSATIRSHLAIAYGRAGRTQEAKAEANAFKLLEKTENVLVPPNARSSRVSDQRRVQ
jgi:tetratricopeptide (TPR) repeat protein